ncbi:MAG: hypothetical protein O2897_05570 [bacterium]|nr:hypothetical protein [bacterium]
MEINATLIVQSFIFLALLIWLSRFLFQPFLRLFDERDKCITGAKQQALLLTDDVKKNLAEIDEKIKNAQKHAKQLLLNLRAEGLEYQRHVLDLARKDAKVKSETASAELRTKLEKSKVELIEKVPVLASEVLACLLNDVAAGGFTNSHLSKMESRGA